MRIWILAGLAIVVCISWFFVIKLVFFPSAGAVMQKLEPLAPGSAPEVASARILPDNPRLNTPLTVEYQGRGPEGAPVQYTFRWYVDGGIIQEGSTATLEPGSIKKGDSVSVEIIPSSLNGQGIPFKSESVQIANSPPSLTSVSVTPPQPVPGSEIMATALGEDPDHEEVTFRYQWTVNGAPVANLPQESNRFSTKALRKKDDISVTVTPWDGESAGVPLLSEILTLGNSAPRVTSTPPMVLRKGVYTYQVTASDPDGDTVTFSLVQGPEGMVIDPVSGLLRWEPPKQVPERKEIAVHIKADDGDGGSIFQEYSFFLEVQ
jgi:hypothetical protein